MPSIISGKRRGAKLLVPEGLGVRPTLARVREALFSMLTSELGTFVGCRVLDPFAGAGMLGLEAWSRGAAHVDLIEMNRAHFAILNKNVATLKAQNEVRTILGQTPKCWNLLGHSVYDLVVCDPPYHEGLMPETLRALLERDMIRPSSVVTVELEAGDSIEMPEELEVFKERVYGKCQILCVRRRVAREAT